ncbi:hypothetical protein, partial [Serratia sp. N21D137]|uniref:hypothetical protein n=1 Tax=Serratia sp. N21D137 TaxID=3397495 RepID=UPI0039E1E559
LLLWVSVTYDGNFNFSLITPFKASDDPRLPGLLQYQHDEIVIISCNGRLSTFKEYMTQITFIKFIAQFGSMTSISITSRNYPCEQPGFKHDVITSVNNHYGNIPW